MTSFFNSLIDRCYGEFDLKMRVIVVLMEMTKVINYDTRLIPEGVLLLGPP